MKCVTKFSEPATSDAPIHKKGQCYSSSQSRTDLTITTTTESFQPSKNLERCSSSRGKQQLKKSCKEWGEKIKRNGNEELQCQPALNIQDIQSDYLLSTTLIITNTHNRRTQNNMNKRKVDNYITSQNQDYHHNNLYLSYLRTKEKWQTILTQTLKRWHDMKCDLY